MTHRHFIVVRAPNRTTAWSTAPLPFEPTGWASQMRHELRTALDALLVPGSALTATWWCARGRADLENVLLYNVGTDAFSAATGPLLLRRGRTDAPNPPGPLAASSVVEYRTDSPEVESREPLLELRCALPEVASLAALRAEAVWRACHRAKITGTGDVLPGALALRVTVSGSHPRAFPAGVVKPLIDGLFSALHRYSGAKLEEVVPRITGIPAAQARAWLLNEEMGFLGPHNYVWPWSSGLQWSPADDRLTEISLRVSRQGPAELHAILLRG